MAKKKKETAGIYFKELTATKCFHSGSTLLDCVLGGGWAEARIANLVGDKSTGKTLLAIEACKHFADKYPGCKIHYAEAEAAFDPGYAEMLGLDLSTVQFYEGMHTVENWHDHIQSVIDESEGKPTLYILDSLDALSDKAELDREIDKASYGATKARQLSEIFRRVTASLSKSNVTLIIISQVRENIGVTFGEKHTRSGGKALDFYCSQILWLAHIGKIDKEKKGIKRTIGVQIRARCKKNKVGPAWRDCEFPLYFGAGINDFMSCAVWLADSKPDSEKVAELAKEALAASKKLDSLEDDEYFKLLDRLTSATRKRWIAIEKLFAQKRRVRHAKEVEGQGE